MKKLILALVCGLLLTSCAPADAGSGSGAESAGAAQSAVESASGEAGSVDSKPEEPEAVKAAVEMHEGFYDDENTYGCRPEYFEGDKYVQPDYYGVHVKHVTETSFDFTLLLYEGENEKKPREIMSGTAHFVEDGRKAVCEDLTFVFPNEWNSLPTVVDFCIEGHGPVQDVLFVNNDIPGYQFS